MLKIKEFRIPLLLFLVVSGFLVVSLNQVNDGNFVYTLDDAYIHLALAENIADGHYGINASELSAPSSSLLWPFLLAPFAKTSISHLFPLILNLIFAGGTLYLFSIFIAAVSGQVKERISESAFAVGVILLMLSSNLIGLIFTGMEHSLQLLISIGILLGMIRYFEKGAIDWWLTAALILGPLIRYEMLALSVPAIIMMFPRRDFKPAFTVSVSLLLALGLFSTFLYLNDLGWLPSSVMAKSKVAQASGSLMSFFDNFRRNFEGTQGRLLALGLLALSIVIFRTDYQRPERSLACWAVSAGLLHLMAGRFGWYDRYEIYAWTIILLSLIYCYRKSIFNLRSHVKSGLLILIVVLVSIVIAKPYYLNLSTTRVASNNIYQQQGQMRRFVTDYYKASVAANDIGFLSYKNSNYVLDLWGLGSTEALNLRRTSNSSSWITELTDKYDIKLAMVYDQWIVDRPDNWQLLGYLKLGRRRITPAADKFSFYALDSATYNQTKELLVEFSATLPDRAEFEFVSD